MLSLETFQLLLFKPHKLPFSKTERTQAYKTGSSTQKAHAWLKETFKQIENFVFGPFLCLSVFK